MAVYLISPFSIDHLSSFVSTTHTSPTARTSEWVVDGIIRVSDVAVSRFRVSKAALIRRPAVDKSLIFGIELYNVRT